MEIRNYIDSGKAVFGMELGSTRIKAVLIGEDCAPIASGSYEWENRLENGYWTYHMDDVWTGVRAAYKDLCRDAFEKYGARVTRFAAMGISGMMHGYLPFDVNGSLLAPFRTWRNTSTGPAADELTSKLDFNIPQRWSAAHLYQAILNGEEHVSEIAYLTTLAGYVHWTLTGEKVMGIGEASGMFPIDSAAGDFDAGRVGIFDGLLAEKGMPFKFRDIFPKVLRAGDDAGALTKAGAMLLDETGALEAGIPMCPPEGDAGTGMAATGSVSPRTGNVSAGTSAFAMAVLEKPMEKVHQEIDMVTTPSGAPVAMVHCNTCTSDLNAWVDMLGEMAVLAGAPMDKGALFTALFKKAMEGDADCGGLVNFNCYGGEPVIHLENGAPLMARGAESRFTLANVMRAQIYSSMATLCMGMDILFNREGVRLDRLYGHGGLFKTPKVAQPIMAAALGVDVAVMETAGEGGPWGMALLAAYKARRTAGETLEEYLANRVFAYSQCVVEAPNEDCAKGFAAYMQGYKALISAEAAAGDVLLGK